MQLWFGSSGGGLPRRPELKSSGRFFIGRGQWLLGQLENLQFALRAGTSPSEALATSHCLRPLKLSRIQYKVLR